MHPETCPNCGTELHGPFCHQCGQKDVDLDRPFFSLLGEWLSNLFAFDARVWRTLGPLMAKPGFLTAEYLQGRRDRYVPPLRLYFFASIAMFLALAWGGYSIVTSEDDLDSPVRVYTTEGGIELKTVANPAFDAPDDGVVTEEETGAVEDQESATPEASEAPEAAGDGEGGWSDTALRKLAEAPPSRVNAVYRQRLAQTLILLAFVFAAFLRLLFWRHGRLFRHLIFSIHVHAAAFVGIVLVNLVGSVGDLAAGLLGMTDWVSGALSLLYFLAIPIYIFLALRRVYGLSRLSTIWRFLVLQVVYVISLALTLLGTMVLTGFML